MFDDKIGEWLVLFSLIVCLMIESNRQIMVLYFKKRQLLIDKDNLFVEQKE